MTFLATADPLHLTAFTQQILGALPTLVVVGIAGLAVLLVVRAAMSR